MNSNFLDDVEITDKLFDELLTELEFDNYSKNDFITFNNYNTDNSFTGNATSNPTNNTTSTGSKAALPPQANFVMFGSANHLNTSSLASFSSSSIPTDYSSNYNNSNTSNFNQQLSFGGSLPAMPVNYNSNQSTTLYSLPPQISSNSFQQQLQLPPTIQQPNQQPLFPHNGGTLSFSADLNARINEEIFKDEEDDLLGQYSSPQYTYYSSSALSPPSNTASIPVNAGDYTPTSGGGIPHSPSDDGFVIGAVSLSSKTPTNQLQYTHHTLSSSTNGTTVPNVNLHKSSVKRKNNVISDEDESSLPRPASNSAMNSGSGKSSIAGNVATKTTTVTPLPSSSTSNSKVHPLYAKFVPLLDFTVVLFQAFNGGDLTKVKEIILEHTTKDCSLKTPSLPDEVHGQNYLVDLFNAISEAHPDAVYVAKKCKFQPENLSQPLPSGQLPSISCRIYFAGTRIFKPQLMSQITDLNFDNQYGDYLFKRPNSSLLDEMDTSEMSIQMKVAMKELETRGKNLSIFGKGTMDLTVNQDEKINGMRLNWVITSFREADL